MAFEGSDQRLMQNLALKTLSNFVNAFQFQRWASPARDVEHFALRLTLGERRYTATVELRDFFWTTRHQSDREVFDRVGPDLVAELWRKLAADERDPRA